VESAALAESAARAEALATASVGKAARGNGTRNQQAVGGTRGTVNANDDKIKKG
jgi:hypothetical protein